MSADSFFVNGLRNCVACLLIFILAGSAAATQPSGLVAYWSMDGSADDAGPNSLTGTLYGDARLGSGKVGGGLVLDGNGDYVGITDATGAFPAALGNLSQGTVSVWFKFTEPTGVNTIHPVFYLGQGSGGDGQTGVVLEVGHFWDGDYRLYWTTYSSPDPLPNPAPYPGEGYRPSTCFDTDFNLTQDQWYHFAVTVGPEGNTGYLNGQELTDRHYFFNDETSTEFFADIPSPQQVWLGQGFLGFIEDTQNFPGQIDELSIYDRPLTAEEIGTYYQSTVPEPATLSLLALGGMALLRRRRK